MKKITSYIDQLTNLLPSYPSTALPSPSSLARPEPPIRINSRSGRPRPRHGPRPSHCRISTNRRRCLIDILPDDVLLKIFDFCTKQSFIEKGMAEVWQSLVHVCRRWRTLVFGSPRHLDLQLVCSGKTPAGDMLDIWPALPLVIYYHNYGSKTSMDNSVAALRHSNRVRVIKITGVSSSYLEDVCAATQEPFPELTRLVLVSDNSKTMPAPVLPDSFLGGSAPRLLSLEFDGISFPGLPKLLWSAIHLVDLHLYDIPHSGYISPEDMATALSTLTSLERLQLEFQSPLSRPDGASRPPPHSTLPVLTFFSFKGVGEYLDDLVARIDAPQLSDFVITFFSQIVFDTPQLIQFISRTSMSKTLQLAHVSFGDCAASVMLSSRTSRYRGLKVKISCKELDWQVSSLEQVCTRCLPPLSTLEDLYISEFIRWQPDWQDNVENMLWLELLHPFSAVKNLYLSEEFARRIVPALQQPVDDRATELLPALQNILLERLQTSGPVQKGIRRFVAARQASHPVAVSRWDYPDKTY